MGRKNKILVPEAREGLDQLKEKLLNERYGTNDKYEIAKEQGVQVSEGYNGDIKAKDAGRMGGSIGGSMVRELVRMAEQQMGD
ncbi:alpha/beta-type small acid-soluble spore protein [Thalassobacillus devorans]|uniref:alpha/beta-type small acid-soluble spore protein n=1 Tax=Thalassobacillus devorans TaxID=279813 RepID=UPI00048B9FC9|nr:alpha/beta-type small acid-soluble spore protein [Thalassobacillus devorans]